MFLFGCQVQCLGFKAQAHYLSMRGAGGTLGGRVMEGERGRLMGEDGFAGPL